MIFAENIAKKLGGEFVGEWGWEMMFWLMEGEKGVGVSGAESGSKSKWWVERG